MNFINRIQLIDINNNSVGTVSAELVPDHLISKVKGIVGDIDAVVVPDWHRDYILTHEEYETLHGEEPLPYHYLGHKEEQLIHALLECDYYS